jgi:hypothetical protein
VEGYSPALLERIVSQGGRYAFKEAAHNLEELAGCKLSAVHVERLTERVGWELAAQRDEAAAAHKQGRLPRAHAHAPAAAAVMLDGGRLQTRAEPSPPGVMKPAWHEPKYACCLTLDTKPATSDPQPEPPAKFLDQKAVPQLVQELQRVRAPAKERQPASPPPRTKPQKKRTARRPRRWLVRTVVATMADVHEFKHLVAAEVQRRSLDRAQWKACVCDGQASNWTVYTEELKPLGFVGILDFLHLLAYLYGAAQAAGGSEGARWQRYCEWLRWAWNGRRDKLLLALNGAVATAGEPPDSAGENDPRRVVLTARNYVANNTDKMDYPRYRRLGLPLSSAPVESLIKQFNKRVKGSEKFWRSSAAEAILQVRAAQLSEDGRMERFWATPRHCRAANSRLSRLAA